MLDKQRLRTFVLGGVVGALAGILLAPRSGKELRGSIASRAGEARERGRETYFEAQERMQERVFSARERSSSGEEARTREPSGPLPKLEPVVLEPVLDPEPPLEEPSIGSPARTSPPDDLHSLYDVSPNAFCGPAGENPDPEELRRRIREIRARLD
ncbi:MAG TPA: YtxH domain-containing protein, partial [Rubrobacteraceae bacterium]|nr:YtxH domain-containing protein [Rubrobacteraceae bacterium]